MRRDSSEESTATTSHTAYLGLGANIGNRAANLRMALRLLPPVDVLEVSSLYETEPVGLTAQPPFYNAVCYVATDLSPRDLLHHLKQVEHAIGRRPGIPWGPRPIDLDILFYDEIVLSEPDLELPHPRLAERAFVLAPLAEIAPELRHPVLGRTIAELLSEADQHGIRLIEGRGWKCV